MSRIKILMLVATVGLVVAIVAALPASAGPPRKFTICHKPGTPDQKTLTLPQPAAMAHVSAHGDWWGGCGGRIIDADGTASAGDGVPGAIDAGLIVGAPLTPFPQPVFNNSGLDMFDNDGDNAWTFGPNGDDLHVEAHTFCPTGIRDGLHDLGRDCVVLDLDGSFFQGQQVSCDLEVGAFCVPPLPSPITFHDANGNFAWDNGEDIVLDVNNNGIFD